MLTFTPDGKKVIVPLAYKNYNENHTLTIPIALGIIELNNVLDASNRDDVINIRNYPVFGMY